MLDENDTNAVDPRVDDEAVRATEEELDESYGRQLRDDITAVSLRTGDVEKAGAKEDERIYVEFEPDDPRNPFNFSRRCAHHSQHIMRRLPQFATFADENGS
jgi:hypothetical protein